MACRFGFEKTFGRIEHNALFIALARQGVPSSYVQLLKTMYTGQHGSVNGIRKFQILRGVKQGDILSPLLFNAGLEETVRSWKNRLGIGGINIGHVEGLTNIRFADGLMLHSKAESELVYMLEPLSQELRNVGLRLNPQKTKTLTTKKLTSPTFLDVDGDMIFVLHGKDQQHYLGRVLCGNLRNCSTVECSHRIRVAWSEFHIHRHTLLNTHMSPSRIVWGFSRRWFLLPRCMDWQPCHYPKSSLQIWTWFSVVYYDALLVGGVLTMKRGQVP